MIDMNNNGIDDALEVEQTRTIKNADGSSQTDTVWRKNNLPSPMQNQMPGLDMTKPGLRPRPMNGTPQLNESVMDNFMFSNPSANTTKLWNSMKESGSWSNYSQKLRDEAAKSNQAFWTPSQNNNSIPVPMTDTPEETNTQTVYPAPDVMTDTPEQTNTQTVYPAVTIPAVMRQNPAIANPWDTYNEQLRQIRLNMGIGGAGNAKTNEEKQLYAITSVMNANRGSKKIQEWGKSAIGNLAATNQNTATAMAATKAAQEQELKKQKLVNEGLVGAAGAKGSLALEQKRLELQNKLDVENIKSLGGGSWKNFTDPTTGKIVPFTYINDKNDIKHVPPPAGYDALITEATGENPVAVTPVKATTTIPEGSTATSKDGKRIVFKGGKWVPMV